MTSHAQLRRDRKHTINNLVMYESPSDLPNEKNPPDTWSALASTEKWISTTLSGISDTHSRKQISYVCDPGDNMEVVVAGTFRRLREMRETGETHGEAEKERLSKIDDQPRTHRETQVVVLPSCGDLDYPVFDKIVTTINKARRNARDYVTDVSIEKRNDFEDGEAQDWITSVNLSHMHPSFEDEVLQKHKQDTEVDEKYIEYLEKKQMARRSPFPTLVIEVRSSPPMETEEKPSSASVEEAESSVSNDDISKLESLFTKSAAFAEDSESANDSWDDDIVSTGIEEVASITPLNLAQKWITSNDDLFDPSTSKSIVSDVKHVDAAYEFIFSNIATLQAMGKKSDDNLVEKTRNYLVMPHFLSSSATSFDKFADEVRMILNAMELAGSASKSALQISTFHPEHIEKEYRSPLPIFVLEED